MDRRWAGSCTESGAVGRALKRTALFALALSAFLAPALGAQVRFLETGDDVRIYVLGIISPFEGVLLSTDAERLRMATADGAEMTIPRDQIERSEVRTGRRNTAMGAAVGVGIGLATGVGLLVADDGDCVRDATGFCDPGDTFNQWLLVVPALAGAAAGALVGTAVTTGRWVPAFLPRTDASGGVQLSWALPLRW